MPVTSGTPSRTPPGFKESIHILGHEVKIRYFRSIKDGREPLDGYIHPDSREIWLATYRRTTDSIADTLWHEAMHFMLGYLHKDDFGGLTTELREQIILLFEAGNASVLRNNAWLWSLYAPQ